MTVLEMSARPVLLRPRYMAYMARREAMRICSQMSRTSRKKILTVFDPSLIAFHGHHWEYAQIIKDGCAPTFTVRFYSNFRARTKIVLSLPAQPVCQDEIYPPVGDFDEIYRAITDTTTKALNLIDRRDIGHEAILIMHTVTVFQLGALAQWFSALAASKRPKLLLQLQFPLEFKLPEDPELRKRAIGLARAAADVLVATQRTQFAANSVLLANRISEQLDQHCEVLPLPIRWPDLNLPMAPDPGVVFGFFGGLRPEKGAAILAEAIPLFAAQYPTTRFLVHAPPAESDLSAISALKNIPQVELLQDNFDLKADYFKQFSRASCILLPYDPAEYSCRTSGILVEALGFGRMVITTKGSWLLAESQRRGGTAFVMENYATADLLECLREARRTLISQLFNPTNNRQVTAENSPQAFCSAITRLAAR